MTDEQAAAIALQLAQSRAAHLAYREAIRDKSASKALTQLTKASTLRTAAHAADPTHAAPCWAEEPAKFEHDALMDFYATKLA